MHVRNFNSPEQARHKQLFWITRTASVFIHMRDHIKWLNLHGVYSHYKYRFRQETFRRSICSIFPFIWFALIFCKSIDRWISTSHSTSHSEIVFYLAKQTGFDWNNVVNQLYNRDSRSQAFKWYILESNSRVWTVILSVF